MSDELTDEEEELSQRNYELGMIVMLERLSMEYRECSGKAFANEQDTFAGIYRSIAIDFKVRAKELREKYNKKYHVK